MRDLKYTLHEVNSQREHCWLLNVKSEASGSANCFSCVFLPEHVYIELVLRLTVVFRRLQESEDHRYKELDG